MERKRKKERVKNVLLAGLTKNLHVGGIHRKRTNNHGVVGIVIILNQSTNIDVRLSNGVL